jgi:hypothetical protein
MIHTLKYRNIIMYISIYILFFQTCFLFGESPHPRYKPAPPALVGIAPLLGVLPYPAALRTPRQLHRHLPWAIWPLDHGFRKFDRQTMANPWLSHVSSVHRRVSLRMWKGPKIISGCKLAGQQRPQQ